MVDQKTHDIYIHSWQDFWFHLESASYQQQEYHQVFVHVLASNPWQKENLIFNQLIYWLRVISKAVAFNYNKYFGIWPFYFYFIISRNFRYIVYILSSFSFEWKKIQKHLTVEILPIEWYHSLKSHHGKYLKSINHIFLSWKYCPK